MNWKKTIKYSLLTLTATTVILAFIVHHGICQIYGGNTEVVNLSQFPLNEAAVCINNVSILAADGSSFEANQSVCIENGMIVKIGNNSIYSNTFQQIDGTGKYLIPGLIDSHVHLFKSPNDLLLYVANGVTGIREMIGEDDHLKWREEIKTGRLGPEMFIASPRLGSFDMLEGWFMGLTQGFNNIRNEEDAKEFVEKYHAKGFDAIKIYSHLNREAYDALNKEAALRNMRVVGHIPWTTGIDDILNSNQSEIAHLEELMNAFRYEFGKIEGKDSAYKFLEYVHNRTTELAPKMVQEDVSVTTTLWLTKSFLDQKFDLEYLLKTVELEYENPGISEWNKNIPGGLGWLPHINRYKLDDNLNEEQLEGQRLFWSTYGEACKVILSVLSAHGVNIMAGTDANLPPTVPGFSLHDELIAMNESGMSTVQVLQSATIIPGKWMSNNTGQIATGFKANLVLLNQNPLEDISNTKKINTVFLDGKIINRSSLDQLLRSVKEANNTSRTIEIKNYILEENQTKISHVIN